MKVTSVCIALLLAVSVSYAQTDLQDLIEKGQRARAKASEAAQHLGALSLLDNPQKALSYYRKAVELDPSNVKAREWVKRLTSTATVNIAFDKERSYVDAEQPLKGCFWVQGGPNAGRYCVEETLRKHLGWNTYRVIPAPATSAGPTQVKILLDDLIFAEDFEMGYLSTLRGWEIIGGLPMSDPHVLRLDHWYPVIHLTDGTDDYLFSTVQGDSGSGDTPANTPYFPLLEAGKLASWRVFENESWLDVGGVVKYKEVTFTALNNRDPVTHVGPLDDLQGAAIEGEEMIIWLVDPINDTSGLGLTVDDLSNGTKHSVYTVTSASFTSPARDVFTWTAREQTANGLASLTVPYVYRGLGTCIEIEHGGPAPNPEGRRADNSALYGTGSQWFSWIFAFTATDITSSSYVFWDSPIARLVRDPSIGVDTVVPQLRNNSGGGTWQNVGTAFDIDLFNTVRKVYGFLVNYNSSTNVAELFVNNVSQGTTTITSGIYASGSGDAIWHNNASASSTKVAWFAARHGQRLLDSTEIEARSMYGWTLDMIAAESNLTMAIEFVEGTGTLALDFSHLAGATSTNVEFNNFANIEAAWKESDTGVATMRFTRPNGLLGRPAYAPLQNVGSNFGHYSAGYSADPSERDFRFVAADGGRLHPEDAGGSATCTFTAATKTITGFPVDIEPAPGKQYTFSAGPNTGNLTIERVYVDPRTASSDTATVVVQEALTDDTARAGTWSTVGTTQWDEINSGRWDIGVRMLVEVSSGATDKLSSGFDTNAGTSKFADLFLFLLGFGASATQENLDSIGPNDYGWLFSGTSSALPSAEFAAKSTLSTDSAPSIVLREPDGTWKTKGLLTSPSTADFTWPEHRIESATAMIRKANFDRVRVRYARNWDPVPSGSVPSGSDLMLSDIVSEWREATSGSGLNELIVESPLLLEEDAQAQADEIHSIITTARPYTVILYGPITRAEAAAEPGDVVDITWPANTLLASGKKGILLSWDVDAIDNSAVGVVLFMP